MTKSGVVVQTVRVGDSTVTTYGPDAPPVSVTLHGRTASASIAVEPSRRSQRPFDPTVFEMTLASGHFSREEACEFAKAIDPRGCVTAAVLSPAFQYFGAKWTGPGAPHEDRRGAIATSLVRIDKPGTRSYTLRAWLAWG